MYRTVGLIIDLEEMTGLPGCNIIGTYSESLLSKLGNGKTWEQKEILLLIEALQDDKKRKFVGYRIGEQSNAGN